MVSLYISAMSVNYVAHFCLHVEYNIGFKA